MRTLGESRWPLVVTALVAFGAQLLLVSQRDVLILEWRPTDLAAIALNYYRHGFDFLHPQILWGGNGPGYVEMEFPLIPYSIALLYALFGVHDWVALVVPMLSGIGLAVVLNVFTTRFFGPVAGFMAGLFAATSPTWLAMTTGVWPDPPPIFCGTLALYLLARWMDDGAAWRFVLAASCLALAILLKLTSLYLGLPVAFLFWVKYRQRMVAHSTGLDVRGRWCSCLLRCGTSTRTACSCSITTRSGSSPADTRSSATPMLLTDPAFYIRTFIRLVLFQVTPLGFLLVVIGSVQRVDRAVQYLFHVWLAAVLIYLVVAAKGVSLGHYQYALPLIPPCAALAGQWLRDTFGSGLQCRRGYDPAWRLLVANTVAANYLNQTRGMNFRMQSVQKMRTGRALATLSAPGDLIVVVDADMDDRTPETSMTPPEVFYFSDRRGWYRSMAWLTPEAIEDLRTQGARYLAVSANHAHWFRTHYAALYNECSRRYQVLIDGDDGIVYDLTARSRPEPHAIESPR